MRAGGLQDRGIALFGVSQVDKPQHCVQALRSSLCRRVSLSRVPLLWCRPQRHSLVNSLDFTADHCRFFDKLALILFEAVVSSCMCPGFQVPHFSHFYMAFSFADHFFFLVFFLLNQHFSSSFQSLQVCRLDSLLSDSCDIVPQQKRNDLVRWSAHARVGRRTTPEACSQTVDLASVDMGPSRCP